MFKHGDFKRVLKWPFLDLDCDTYKDCAYSDGLCHFLKFRFERTAGGFKLGWTFERHSVKLSLRLFPVYQLYKRDNYRNAWVSNIKEIYRPACGPLVAYREIVRD